MNCFGRSKLELREYNKKTTVYFSAVIGKIINQVFGIPKGSKVKNNIGIPKFIFDLDNSKKRLFACAAYYCDGVKDRISIVSASSMIHQAPNLLLDLCEILKNLDIKEIEIKPSAVYTLNNGTKHRRWVLNIKNPCDKSKFLSNYDQYRLLL